VLEAIGSIVEIDGVPWLQQGEARQVGINNLTAKILCGRHNSALSPLDTVAGRFFTRLQSVQADLNRRSISMKRKPVLFSGEALELWMLKVACGLFYSKNAAIDGGRLIDDHLIDERLVWGALLHSVWKGGCGLYMKAPQGLWMPVEHSVSMAPLTALHEKRVVGVALTIVGLVFELIFDPVGVNHQAMLAEGWVHRPSELLVEIQTRAHSIGLTWLPGTPPRSVRMINAPRRRVEQS
jgi:hypothetical protein